MQKKYIVRLTDQERETCLALIKKLTGASEKVRRAQILLKTDADGPAWTDARIAEAFLCRTKTVENIRQRFVEQVFEQAPGHSVARSAASIERFIASSRASDCLPFRLPVVGLIKGQSRWSPLERRAVPHRS
jgi:hypothetical protein